MARTREIRKIVNERYSYKAFTCDPRTSPLPWIWQSTLGCYSPYSVMFLSTVTIMHSGIPTPTASITVTDSGGSLNAYSVQVRIQGSPSTQVTSSFDQPTTTSSTSSGLSVNPTSSASSTSNGISPGAAAGIGVGTAVGLILLFLLAFSLIRRKKKQKARLQAAEVSGDSTEIRRSELPGRPAMVELPGRTPPAELPGISRSTELPT